MSTQTLTITGGLDAPRTTTFADGQAARQASACPLHSLVRWDATRGIASRVGIFAFGLVAYAAFFATILYTIGFVNNLLVPKSISSGVGGSLLPSLLINGAFLLAFAVQHTIMARDWFKKWVTRFIPASMERSLFVLAASVILGAMLAFWQPLPQVLWEVTNPIASRALIGLSLFGFAVVFYASFLISHFDLFGLRQVTTNLRGDRYEPVKFQLKSMYKLVRHPLMVGFLIAVWATPLMTVGHLFFAAMITGYIIFGVAIEERDLVRHFGEEYLRYRRSVRAFIPLPKRNGGA